MTPPTPDLPAAARISLDCEANGPGGWAFAAAATFTTSDGEQDRWMARCPIPGAVDSWVEANVLPALTDMPIDSRDVWDLWTGWLAFYRAARDTHPDLIVIGHCVWPAVTSFLVDAHADNIKDGPYPLYDVAPLLAAAGHDPRSVDKYLAANELPTPVGSPHHPLYDARATDTAYPHLMAALGRTL